MSGSIRKIKWFFNSYFVEKQIYIRSAGSVRYISLSARSQALLAVFVLSICLWTGFATVRSIFAEQIAQQQTANLRLKLLEYQDRLNQLQVAYDGLNGQLALTKDWFNETTAQLEARHNTLTDMLERHAAVTENIETMQAQFSETARKTKRGYGDTTLVARIGRVSGVDLESRISRVTTQKGEKTLTRISDRQERADTSPMLAPVVEPPVPLIDESLYQRMTNLKTRQSDLVDALEENTDRNIREYNAIIANTSVLDPKTFVAEIAPQDSAGLGGPYIPLKSTLKLGQNLDQQISRIASNLEQLEALSFAVSHIPLARPIHNFRMTSGFGPRMDPIRKRPAFHAGADFGTSTGTPVHATLSGVVTYAGNRGPYGLVVEIDHSNGFKTRYAHLHRIRVRRGQTVVFQERIGDAGNTGRSTGPHLHYEIWYKGRVRNPENFLSSGKQIFNVAETLGVE